MAIIPVLARLTQEIDFEFKASLGYIVSCPRLARAVDANPEKKEQNEEVMPL